MNITRVKYNVTTQRFTVLENPNIVNRDTVLIATHFVETVNNVEVDYDLTPFSADIRLVIKQFKTESALLLSFNTAYNQGNSPADEDLTEGKITHLINLNTANLDTVLRYKSHIKALLEYSSNNTTLNTTSIRLKLNQQISGGGETEPPSGSPDYYTVPETDAKIDEKINERIDDTAYGVSWNGNTDAPTKNAVYDKIQTHSTKLDNITVTQTVNLDTMESDILNSKTKTDFITVTQNINLDNIQSDIASVVDNTIYSASWNGDTTHAPSKDAVYDKIESLVLGGGAGNVIKVGVPIDNQVGVWTGDGTIEGDVNLTFNTSTDTLSTVNIAVSGTVDGRDVSVDGAKLDNITITQAVNLDTIESDLASVKTKVDHITITQAVNLDTMESDIASAKTKTDYLTVTQAIDLDDLRDDVDDLQSDTVGLMKVISDYNASTNTPDLTTSPNSIKNGHAYPVSVGGTFYGEEYQIGDVLVAKQDNPSTSAHWIKLQVNLYKETIKSLYESNTNTNALTDAYKAILDNITVTQAVNLDTMESDLSGVKTKVDNITITQAVDLDTIESDLSGVKTKADHITVTQAVNLDTIESDLAGVKTKSDFITVTQAVDLDAMESELNSIPTMTLTNNKVLHVNGSGAIASATNIEVENNNIRLLNTTTPSAPTSGIVLISDLEAGREVFRYKNSTETALQLQVALYSKRIFMVLPTTGTTGINVVGGNVTSTGTGSMQFTPAGTNRWSALARKRYASSGTAGTANGIFVPAAMWIRNNASNFGGFYLRARFGLGAISLNGSQCFVGFSASTSALAGEPSVLTNIIGMGFDAVDSSAGNFFFMHNDGSGTATKVDLGSSCPRLAGIGYELIMYNPYNVSTVYVKIVRLTNSQVILDTSFSSDLPTQGVGLAFKCETRNGAVASSTDIEIGQIYIETEINS